MPPRLSELMNTLTRYGDLFISQFDSKEDEMRLIVRKFKEIADEVSGMQDITGAVRKGGAVTTGVSVGLGLLFAPFTGGASLALAVAGAAGGGGAVVGACSTKMALEKFGINKVENLGKDFMRIIEPMKTILEEIKTTCEKVVEKLSEVQAEKNLRNMEEFTDMRRRVSELKTKSEEGLQIITALTTFFDDLLLLIVAVFRVTPTSEKGEKLRASIIRSADQCQKVTDELEKMKDKVKDFTGK